MNKVTRARGWMYTALCVWALMACSPALNWREVRPEAADSLVAMFPCKPESQSRQLTLPDLPGGPVTLHVMACEADGARWALSYLDAGTAERRAAALGLLSRALNTNLSMGRTPIMPPKDLGAAAIPGMTAHPDARVWWQTGQRPVPGGAIEPVQVKAWHFSHGLTLYQASVWQHTLQPDDPRLTTFADGFNFPR